MAVAERVVRDPKQQVVLPEAEAERDPKRRERDDDPRPQLVEVIDEA